MWAFIKVFDAPESITIRLESEVATELSALTGNVGDGLADRIAKEASRAEMRLWTAKSKNEFI